ncbi:MAG TPA: universal stress protein [Dongiaceae bacterium]|jgi:nucleotide-binding universal stress UspA family protein|nr:universal stress protein [Dongiaceae bacterium]
MSFKHILVPLFGLDSDRTALDAALAVARAHQAHIQALHAVADPLKTTPLMVDVGVAIAEVVAAAERHAEARSAQAKSAFDGWVRASSVTLAERPEPHPAATAEFRAEKGQESELLARFGRLTDLIIMARPKSEQALDLVAVAVEDALFSAGRPVLLIPSDCTPAHLEAMIKGSAVISWNGSIEAIRSISAARPLLQDRPRVRVINVQDGHAGVQSAADLVHYLAWQGIAASVGETAEAGSIAERLLAASREVEAGLLVMGAYTHSRLKHLVLGGVTSHMIDAANIPVFMTH